MRSGSLLNRRRALMIATGAMLAGGANTFSQCLASAQELDAFSVALDWYPNANHAGLYLALERGYYQEEGLAPDFYTPSDPTTVLQTVGAGRDAFGISYQTDLLLARQAEVPVVSVMAIVQQPLLGIMVMADSGIDRPAKLAGKTVGYPGIPSQEAFLATMLEDDGASLQDIELVNIGFDLIPGLVSGRVAASMGAYLTHEPILAKQEGFDTAMLMVDDWGVPPYYELVMVASEDTMRNQAERTTRFLRATRRGYLAALADPAAAIAALKAASPELPVEVETAGLALLTPYWLDPAGQFGAQDSARWEDYAAWMVSQNLISADLDIASAWTAGLLPAATPVP